MGSAAGAEPVAGAASIVVARATIVSPATLRLTATGAARVTADDALLRIPRPRTAERPCVSPDAPERCKAILFDLP